MAFINEKLSLVQKEMLKKKEIKNPRCSAEILNPNFWTVDHNQKAYLINVGAYHNIPEEEMFVFIYDFSFSYFKLYHNY